MKNWILRASAAAFAAGLMGTMACGGSSCGGSNINSNSSSGTQLNMQCGAGTYLNNNQCVPIPSSNTGASSNAAPVKVLSK